MGKNRDLSVRFTSNLFVGQWLAPAAVGFGLTIFYKTKTHDLVYKIMHIPDYLTEGDKPLPYKKGDAITLLTVNPTLLL